MIAGVLLLLVAVAARGLEPCVGDCDGDGTIAIDELVRGVGIALGTQALAVCPAFDAGADGAVAVDELVRAVRGGLDGCAAAPTASATPAATDTASPPPTPTATASEPPPPSATATASPTATASASATATESATPTHSATATASHTASPTATATAADTVTATATATPTATASATATQTAEPTATSRPNILVINLDDTRADGIDAMPTLLQRIAGEGVSFSEAFTPNAVCNPSRASLLTGLYSFRHGARTVGGEIGGADVFRESGADQQTLAVWLHDAGYATGLFGKYLNDYAASESDKGPGGTYYIPPGWDGWRVYRSPEFYGGVHGSTYSIVDEQGAVTTYDDHTTDAQYSTDVLAAWLREFIAGAAQQARPFFAVYTPYASHSDRALPAPAERHFGLFDGLAPWRPPNWNEADVADKPRWIAALPPDPFGGGFTDAIRRLSYESLLAVDEQIAATLDLLVELGVDEDTVVVFTSDNGASWGEHRSFAQRKGCPYEECLRVPMIVRYPRRSGRAALTREETMLNIDVAPTLAELAGVTVPVAVDGLSRAALLSPGAPPDATRTDLLIEHYRLNRTEGVTYTGQPQDGDRLQVLYGSPRQQPRPVRRFEFDAGDGAVAPGAIAVPVGIDADDAFRNLSIAVDVAVPLVQPVLLAGTNRLSIVDQSPLAWGVYVLEERDQGGVMTASTILPDYFGVRDVAGGYTYVEYETGERELYDLDADPWQLDNRADDPAYGLQRAVLASRLRILLGE